VKKIILIFLMLLLIGCNTENDFEKIDDDYIQTKKVDQVVLERSFMVEDVVTFKLVRDKNLIKDNGIREHLIMLPPSFYETDKTYPFVYYFHGQNNTSEQIRYYQRHLFDEMTNGNIDEAVVVGINYNNEYGGSLMTDSPVTGYWEQAFFEEAMPYFEKKYRSNNKRSLFGFSMGGHVSLRLGFKHSDKFERIYLLAPALFLDDELLNFLKGDVSGYGMAFVYNTESVKLYDMPEFNGSDEDQLIINKWLSGYMNIDEKVNDYLNQQKLLKNIGIELGINDRNDNLSKGTKYLMTVLDENGIEYDYKSTNNGHIINREIFLRAIAYLINEK